MKNHVCLEPITKIRRLRMLSARNQHGDIWAIWTLILGGCTMTYMAIAITLNLYLPF